MFESGIDVTMIGLDVTHKALMTREHAETLRGSGKVGRCVAELYDFFSGFHTRTYGSGGSPIHDAVAVAHVLREGIVETKHLTSRSTARGSSRAAARMSTCGGGPARSRTRTSAWTSTPTVLRAPAGAAAHARVIVAACIAPHGTPAFDPGPTRDALEEVARRFERAEPEAIVVVTPHNVHVEGHFAVVIAAKTAGSLAEWEHPEITLERRSTGSSPRRSSSSWTRRSGSRTAATTPPRR